MNARDENRIAAILLPLPCPALPCPALPSPCRHSLRAPLLPVPKLLYLDLVHGILQLRRDDAPSNVDVDCRIAGTLSGARFCQCPAALWQPQQQHWR